MPRVFLSHSHADREFVRELYHRLTRDGVDCFLDAESIGWGENWVRALERALDECQYVVLILSPDFCNSEWSQVERTSAMAAHPAAWAEKVRPLMLRDCLHLSTFPPFLRQVQMIDVSTAELFEANYERICGELGGQVRRPSQGLDRTSLPPVQRLPGRNRMPYHSLGDNFVGRVDALWQIHDQLHNGSTAIVQGVGVVAGTGGLGKTQSAIEYVHRFGAGYPGGVYWVDAERGLAMLVSQVAEAAGLDINTKAEERTQAQQLWTELNKLPPSLIVLDNFPEEVPIRPYLPTTGRTHTLVTTRRRDLIGLPHVFLDFLSVESGTRLLNSGPRKLAPGDAEQLVRRLGGLPLAIELAKAYLNYRTQLTVAQVLTEMDRRGEIGVLRDFAKKYRNELPSGHELDVAHTFQMSWDLTPEPSKDVLRAMAELAPLPVPRSLVRAILGLEEAEAFHDELDESLSELHRLSLVELDGRGNPVLHRLVHAFVRSRNQADDVSLFELTAEMVNRQMSRTNADPDGDTLRELDLILPHADYLVSSASLVVRPKLSLMNFVGLQHQSLGRYMNARESLTAALRLAESELRPGDLRIILARSNLAVVLQHLGQLDGAISLLRTALSSAMEALAPGHPAIATIECKLAMVLKDLGKPEEARDLLRRALVCFVNRLEAGHSAVATIQSNLAMVLKDLGRLEEARDLLRSALDSDEKTFENSHPSIAVRRSNLALVLQDLGELREARDLLRKALESADKTWVPGHPTTAIMQSNLALILRDLRQLNEAKDLASSALMSDERTFAPGHPSIARSQWKLALVLQDLGQLQEAHDLVLRALTSAEQTYPPGHATITARQRGLAEILLKLGRTEEAEELLRRANSPPTP